LFQRVRLADVPLDSPIYVVRGGDSAASIAERCGGDWHLWRELAEFNELPVYEEIPPGTDVGREAPSERERHEDSDRVAVHFKREYHASRSRLRLVPVRTEPRRVDLESGHGVD
jgi:hypothetical protein